MKKCFTLPLGIALLVVLLAPSTSSAATEITLPEGTRLALQLNKNLSTQTNSEGDPFTAVVTENVYFGDRIVIPKGSVVNGSISRIVRPGRFKGKAMMNFRFQSVDVLSRGQLPITATLVSLGPERNGGVRPEGTVKGEGSTAKDVGRVLVPTIAGAGIGSIAGGGRGAEIGAGIGAAIGLTAIFTTAGKDLEVHRGSTMDIQLDRPLVIPPEADDASNRSR